MPLTRCSNQDNSLEEFYSECASESNIILSRIGKVMLEVVDLINKTFVDTEIFGLTSHESLLLFSEDDWMSDWYIAIVPNGLEEYHIEYKMAKENQPWENAFVNGGTKSLDKFKELVIISMFESKGWQKSKELKNLYKQIKK
nr:hypothetical protein [uncultured Flavobacterium sp.]